MGSPVASSDIKRSTSTKEISGGSTSHSSRKESSSTQEMGTISIELENNHANTNGSTTLHTNTNGTSNTHQKLSASSARSSSLETKSTSSKTSVKSSQQSSSSTRKSSRATSDFRHVPIEIRNRSNSASGQRKESTPNSPTKSAP